MASEIRRRECAPSKAMTVTLTATADTTTRPSRPLAPSLPTKWPRMNRQRAERPKYRRICKRQVRSSNLLVGSDKWANSNQQKKAGRTPR